MLTEWRLLADSGSTKYSAQRATHRVQTRSTWHPALATTCSEQGTIAQRPVQSSWHSAPLPLTSCLKLKFRFDTVAFILQHHNLMCDGAVAVLATK